MKIDFTTNIIEEPFAVSEISVYPNPSSSTTTFQFADNSEKELIIVDNFGREIWRKQTIESSVEFPADEFSAGMYFYRVEQRGNISATGKLIIE